MTSVSDTVYIPILSEYSQLEPMSVSKIHVYTSSTYAFLFQRKKTVLSILVLPGNEKIICFYERKAAKHKH